MNAFSQAREGRVFKISMLGAQDTCKKFLGDQLLSHWFQSFCSSDLQGTKVSMEQAGLHLSSKPFSSRACLSLVEKILCYPSGLQSSLTARNWEVNPMQTTGALTQGWQWALERGGESGKSFPLAKGKYFPWLSSPPSVCRCTAPSLGWIPEWSNNSVLLETK